jgi:hypothetical protein
MLKYLERNVNPKNRKTGDCSTRALVSVLNISYEDCLKLQMEESLKCYYDPTSKQVMERVLKRFGYIKMSQPKKSDNSKYEVRELDQIINKNILTKGVLVTVANHHTAIVGNQIIDIWNCGRKCVGNYYIKID